MVIEVATFEKDLLTWKLKLAYGLQQCYREEQLFYSPEHDSYYAYVTWVQWDGGEIVPITCYDDEPVQDNIWYHINNKKCFY